MRDEFCQSVVIPVYNEQSTLNQVLKLPRSVRSNRAVLKPADKPKLHGCEDRLQGPLGEIIVTWS
jgi:hypothetical protein